ncbi:MAG: glycosyltransferase family 2 protein [Chlamydiia bacterium]|nr:glycosyltransferase family 2 protein [Chlamydiia bacterium]
MHTRCMRHFRLFIVLLNWNGKSDTLECLASLSHIHSFPFQTVVVDNGSTDDSVSAIRAAYPDVPLIETGHNLGFAGGNNPGIEWALSKGAEWILLLNNDTIVAPDFLDAFMASAHSQPNAKILGAKIYRYHAPQTIDHLGGLWNPSCGEFFSPAQGKIDDGISFEQMEPVDYVCGAALLMHKSVPETVGFLEPRFFLFWEETDFCARARRAGFGVWTAPKAKIWHKVSASFVGGKPHAYYFWWRSRLLWVSRNCTPNERKKLYREVLLPEMKKSLRHYVLRSLQALVTHNAEARQKALRCKAGLAGILHYAIKRFGNCPSWLTNQPKSDY